MFWHFHYFIVPKNSLFVRWMHVLCLLYLMKDIFIVIWNSSRLWASKFMANSLREEQGFQWWGQLKVKFNLVSSENWMTLSFTGRGIKLSRRQTVNIHLKNKKFIILLKCTGSVEGRGEISVLWLSLLVYLTPSSFYPDSQLLGIENYWHYTHIIST